LNGSSYAGTASRLVTGLVTVGCDHTRILAPNVALLKGRQVTVVQEHGVAGAEDLLLQRGAYLASTEGIRCESRSEGLKGLFAQGLFVLRATGTGTMFFSGYGAIDSIDLDGGSTYTIDNGYVVAWEPSLSYRLTKARKIRSFLFSDQLLLSFSGRGRVWINSRSPQSLASWVHPFRRVNSKDFDSD
jgi:uncharacterized protein (TIGR00266 family)